MKIAKNAHNAKAIAYTEYTVCMGQKKNCLKHAKNITKNTLTLFFEKKKPANIGKTRACGLKIAKNGHNTKAIANAKYRVWLKNYIFRKHA